MASCIFIPTGDERDKLIEAATTALEAKISGEMRENAITAKPGERRLGTLHDANPAVLYIVGHGNFGQGIGTHANHFGARRLVAMLQAEGLQTRQRNLIIHLYACNTGVTCERATFFGKRTPYIERFTQELVLQRFDRVQVVGYAGFVGAFLDTTLGYFCYSGTRDLDTSQKIGSCTRIGKGEREVIWEVGLGWRRRVSGYNWEMDTSVFQNKIHIRKG
jgi:hypothetical protein